MKQIPIIAILALMVSCGGEGQKTVAPPTNGQSASLAEPVPNRVPPVANLSCLLNGRDWKGNDIFNGHLYYAKGIAQMFDGAPYMMLSFKAMDAPDNRQLTISFKNFQGKTGVYAKEKLEVLLSGSASGDAQKSELQGHKTPGQSTDFSVDITDWQPNGANEVIISGKLGGTLKGMMGSADVKIENGSFANVKIKVFNEKY